MWVDGSLRTPESPVIDALDHAFMVGDGVFETLAVVGGRPFALRRHLERLAASAAGMGWTTDSTDEVLAGIAAVLAAGGERVGRLRVTLSAGRGQLGLRREAGRAPVVVVAGAAPQAPADVCHALRVPWVRNERSAIAGLKTTSYAEAVVMARHAAEHGASEVLLANTVGDLCEGATSNVFIERDGELYTPALSSGCLAGVTRALVIEWARDAGFQVTECEHGELRYGVLGTVIAGHAAAAVTGSVRGVTPVVSIDGLETRAGEVLTAVRRLFAERAALDVNP